jgi:hypothetical protein
MQKECYKLQIAALQARIAELEGLLRRVPHSLSAEMEGLDKDIDLCLSQSGGECVVVKSSDLRTVLLKIGDHEPGQIMWYDRLKAALAVED